jgi:hypothetical protein
MIPEAGIPSVANFAGITSAEALMLLSSEALVFAEVGVGWTAATVGLLQPASNVNVSNAMSSRVSLFIFKFLLAAKPY